MSALDDASGIVPTSTLVSKRAYYAVAVLFAINMVGYLDRQIITLLVQPVKTSLRLSDGQIGLMQGAAFVLAFSIAGLFLGRLVDRRNRRNILMTCVLVWSVSAAASGLAQNAWQLFAARMGVGVGEAALLPAAISLISDYFDAERRGKALGFFITGIYAGAGISLVLVGFALPAVNLWASDLAAYGVAIEPWRLVMVSMLVPGLICCALLASLQEPARASATSKNSPLDWSGFRDWAIRLKIFIPHHVGFALATFGGFAISAWLPTILIREHAFGARQAGMTYGTLVAVVGCASAYIGGVLGDYRSHQNGSRGRISVAIYSIPFAIAGFALMWLVQSALAVFVGTILVTAGLGIAMVIGLLSISDLSPPESRGQISSIYLMFTGFIGSAGGPAIVGYANDVFGRSDRPLSTILGTTGMVTCIAALALIRLSFGRIHGPVK